MANNRTRDLAHQLREALGEHTSAQTEQVLRDLWRDDLARNELFSRLQDREREPLTRLWENYGPGRRLTHHPGPGFQARVRWQDTTTTMRRGAVRAALAREFGDAAAVAAGSVHASPAHAMSARSHAELAAQLEAAAPPLLEFARDAYRRGWAEETQAPDDIEKARALLRPFVQALEPLSASLDAKRRGAWLELDGWRGTSACNILHGLASTLVLEIERGQLPRDRRHLVGEGMSKVLVPAWWDRLRRHLRHEVELLAGRESEPIEESPSAPRRLTRTEPTTTQQKFQKLTQDVFEVLNHRKCSSTQVCQRLASRGIDFGSDRTVRRCLKALRNEKRIDVHNRQSTMTGGS